jgi:hypothetical protein
VNEAKTAPFFARYFFPGRDLAILAARWHKKSLGTERALTGDSAGIVLPALILAMRLLAFPGS